MIDLDTLKEKILSNEKIKKLIEENNLNEEQINDSMHIFFDILEDEKDEKNKNAFYTSEIEIQKNGVVNRKLVPTAQGIKEENKKNYILKNITIMNYDIMPSINNKSVDSENKYLWGNQRKELMEYFAKTILVKFKKNEYFKGVYLYGKFGVGKSCFTQAMANYFASNGKTVAYINNNDLSNHLKELFSIGYKKTIDSLKEVDFLFIDDIGSEKSSTWMLSEILFSILSYRMQMKKTTFFTSNFSYEKLEAEFSKEKEISKFKVKRLIERIEVLSYPILLKDNNWRKKQ